MGGVGQRKHGQDRKMLRLDNRLGNRSGRGRSKESREKKPNQTDAARIGTASRRRVKKTTRRKHSVRDVSKSFSSSDSEPSRRRVPKHYSKKVHQKHKKKIDDRRRHPNRHGRSPILQSSESEATYTESSTSTQYRRKVMSADTAENSESKLQDIGQVVNADDLSDYSDHFTLDSEDMEGFEEFMYKHRNKSVHHTSSDESANSNLYSLNDSSDHATSTGPSDNTSGIVASVSADADKDGVGNCGYQACFCIDDESLQGSYGGLRDGEILIAASTISTHVSVEHIPETTLNQRTDNNPVQESIHSRRMERMESHMDSSFSQATGKEHETAESEETPALVSCFWCWDFIADEGTATTEEVDNVDSSEAVESGEADEVQLPTAEATTSARSRTVVWQRSDDETYDSTADDETIPEERTEAIAKKARESNILNSFRPLVEETSGVQDANAKKDATEDDLKKEAEAIQSKFLQTDTSRDKQAKQPDKVIFLLGDNVIVTGVNEMEAGNGDTAFLIFLRATSKELSENGKAEVARRHFQDHPCGHSRTNMAVAMGDQEKSFEAPIVVLSEDENPSIENPCLVIEEKASAFLENLNHLSEASYYCSDKNMKTNAKRVFKAHREGLASGVEVASSKSHGSLSEETSATSYPVETVSQYMFCMRVADMPRCSTWTEETETATETISSSLKVASSVNVDGRGGAQQAWSNEPLTLKAEVDRYIEYAHSEAVSQSTDSAALNAASSIESSATERREVDDYIESLAVPDVSSRPSQEDSPPKCLRGMSRSTVRAHALLQAGKKPRYTAKLSSPMRPNPGATVKESEKTPGESLVQEADKNAGKEVFDTADPAIVERISSPQTTPPTAPESPSPPANTTSTGGEDSTSSRLSIRSSFGHRSSGDDSLKGTKYLGENNKSGSSSNHSASIQKYLVYLDAKDPPHDDHNALAAAVESTISADDDFKDDKHVVDVEEEEEEELDQRDETKGPHDPECDLEREGLHPLLPFETLAEDEPLPVPGFVARLSREDMESVCMAKNHLTADERRLQYYTERSRLSYHLLLADTSGRQQGRTCSAATGSFAEVQSQNPPRPFFQFEKSQIDETGLSKRHHRRANGTSVSSSHGSSTSSSEEFFDAMSRNSSSVSGAEL